MCEQLICFWLWEWIKRENRFTIWQRIKKLESSLPCQKALKNSKHWLKINKNEEVIQGLELKKKEKTKCHMLTFLEFLNLDYWSDNIENTLLASALPTSLSDLILKRRKLPANGKQWSFPMCWLNEKPRRHSHNGQMSKYISLVDIILVTGNGYIFTMFDNTQHRFLRAGDRIGDNSCHK